MIRSISSTDILAIAVEALSWVELDETIGFRSAIVRAVSQFNVKKPTLIRIARNLVYETLNRRNLIDKILEDILDPAELSDFELGVQAFLRLFVYMTEFVATKTDNVDLANQGRSVLGWETLAPVEPFLGRMVSNRPEDTLQLVRGDERTAFETYNPTWFVRYATRLLGRSGALRLLSSKARPRIFMRLNVLGNNKVEVLRNLSAKGLVVEPVPVLPLLYEVTGKDPNLRSELGMGHLQLQDLPSSLAAVVGRPRPKTTVLVASASPATVPIYLSQLMHNKGLVVVFDDSKERLRKVQTDSIKSGVSILHVEEQREDGNSQMSGDLILIPARSSRCGVFWREPSLKWRITQDSLKYYAKFQGELLDLWAPRVRGGGSLVYWTRSIAVEENEMVLERFLSRHPEFSISETLPRLGIPGLRGQWKSQRLFPHLHSCDGAFVAMLMKT